jgi:TPR repeat protein
VGFKEDPGEAAKWLTKALAQGLESWQVGYESCILGDAYYFGRSGVVIDYAEAFKWYRVAADAGVQDDCMVKVGMMYAAGEGVLKDDAEAAKYYRMAAELDSWDGWYKLGMCFKNGVGVEKNSQEAEKWLLLAALKSHEEAQYELGLMLVAGDAGNTDGCDELYWFKEAGERGHVLAQLAAAEVYEARGDLSGAYAWYRIAISNGKTSSQAKMDLLLSRMSQEDILSGRVYHAGLLTSFAKTAAWKAKQDLEEAQGKHANALGRLGEAQGKHADALGRLGDCYFYGRGVPKNYCHALTSYREAAKHGSKSALYQAGLCCLNREEPYRDEIAAYAYLSLASTFYGLSARDELAKLEVRMSPDDRVRGQEIANMIRDDIEANELGG